MTPLRTKALLGILAAGFMLVMGSCYGPCECNDRGSCFEGSCGCDPGYLGEHCELVANEFFADTFAVVSVSDGGDSLQFTSIINTTPSDLINFTVSNFHGTTTVAGTFDGRSSDDWNAYFTIPSQPLDSATTVSGSAFYDQLGDRLEFDYYLHDSTGNRLWFAKFAR